MESIRTTMSGCTETGKPRIAILMAVYEPRMDWLREQLLSLNAQTYPNLMLYIRDDCSPTVPFEEIQSCVQDCIRAFPYEIRRNEENLGSNGTFELLTREAEGEYFAYCDQDDVWLPQKLSCLEAAMAERTQMAYCDMEIIDGDGRKIAGSLKEIRPRLRYVQGEGLAEAYFSGIAQRGVPCWSGRRRRKRRCHSRSRPSAINGSPSLPRFWGRYSLWNSRCRATGSTGITRPGSSREWTVRQVTGQSGSCLLRNGWQPTGSWRSRAPKWLRS